MKCKFGKLETSSRKKERIKGWCPFIIGRERRREGWEEEKKEGWKERSKEVMKEERKQRKEGQRKRTK